MKYRKGFVSNSSSSSFVILGYKMNDIDNPYDFAGELGLDCIYDGNENCIIGKTLASVSSDEGYMEDEEFTHAKLEKIGREINKALIIKGKIPSLFLGTRES